MNPCRTCGTPFAGDACPRCGVQRGAPVPTASGPSTPVSQPTPPAPFNPYAPPGGPYVQAPASPYARPVGAYTQPAGPYAAPGTYPPVANPYAQPTSAPGAQPPMANPYAQAQPIGNPYAPAVYTPPPSRGPARHLPLIVGVLAGLLVLGLVYLVIGSVTGTPKAGPASTTRASAKASASTTTTTQSPTPLTPTITPGSTFPDVIVPIGSKECGRFGSGAFDAVGTANESTSCPFAVNVRTAYVASGLNGTPGHVSAHSPTTNLDYDMTCSGTQPVLCTGGVAARVVIYGGRLVPR